MAKLLRITNLFNMFPGLCRLPLGVTSQLVVNLEVNFLELTRSVMAILAPMLPSAVCDINHGFSAEELAMVDDFGSLSQL